MASPTFGQAGTYLSGVNASTAAFAVPTGTAANEVVLVFMYIEGTPAITPPAGFTQILRPSATGAGAHDQIAFWKRCTTTDAGTYSFSWTGGIWREGVAVRFSGCVTSGNPYDIITSNQAATAPSGVTPAVSGTTTVTDTLWVWGGTNFTGGAWTPPSAGGAWTERVDTGADLSVASLAQAGIGASGSVTGTNAGGSTGSTATLIALKSTTSAAAGLITPIRRSPKIYLLGR